MKKTQSGWFNVVLILAICLIFGTASSRHAEAFMKPTHEEVLRKKLNFIKPDVLNQIVAGNLEQDAFFSRTGVWEQVHHFDNSDFKGSTDYIRESYKRAVTAANPSKFDNAALTKEFGHITHAAQDFYAHSDWIELGRSDIVDKKLTNWDPMVPLGNITGTNVVVMQATQKQLDAKNWTWIKGKPRYNYKIKTGAGAQPILISGWFLWGDEDLTPDKVAMPHGGWQAALFYFWNPFAWSQGLHKDYSGRLGFVQAKQRAEDQTLHEFCRLVNLIYIDYQAPGVRNLFQQWLPAMPTEAQFKAMCPLNTGTPWIDPPPPHTHHGGIGTDPAAEPVTEFGPMTASKLFFAVDDLPEKLGGDGHCQLIKIHRMSTVQWTPACRGTCASGACPDAPRTVRAGRDANGQELFKWKCSCQ